jgi:N-methylhydantoinase A
MLERTGAKTALITTDGFRDVYEIGRINRPDAYNLYFQKHKPLIERALRFEVKERVRADGEVVTPLDEARLVIKKRNVRECAADIGGKSYISTCVPSLCFHPRSRDLKPDPRNPALAALSFCQPKC